VRFWQNPEFVRHVRAEMRTPRAVTMAALTLVICALVGLSCWGAADDLSQFFRLFHYWLMGIQFCTLGLWCASACGQAIARERELKTFDFLRTTRLTSWDLMVGKITGAPIMAYFVVGCSLPVSIVTGVLGGISPGTLAGVYLLMLVYALFVSVVALWGSMLAEKSNALVALVVFLAPLGIGAPFAYSPFSGFSALDPYATIKSLYGAQPGAGAVSPAVFGIHAAYLPLSIFLYAAFGVWFVLMLARNLKKERDEICLLSHWQAIGFVAFLNVLYFGFLNPRLLEPAPVLDFTPQSASAVAVALNSAILFLVGVALIGSREKLKVWWRKRAAGTEGYLSGEGIVWPWLVMGAVVAYALLAAEALGLMRSVPLASWQLGFEAVAFLNILVFVVRDVVFLQWCTLTHMKRPLFKGFLYLWLYYGAAGIIASVTGLASQTTQNVLLGLFTPWLALSQENARFSATHAAYLGIAFQVAVTALLLTAINRSLSRPPVLVAATAS
jgi:ABC-type transport system involved in multi-copper enzyme maturation permease subunit